MSVPRLCSLESLEVRHTNVYNVPGTDTQFENRGHTIYYSIFVYLFIYYLLSSYLIILIPHTSYSVSVQYRILLYTRWVDGTQKYWYSIWKCNINILTYCTAYCTSLASTYSYNTVELLLQYSTVPGTVYCTAVQLYSIIFIHIVHILIQVLYRTVSHISQ